MREQTGSAADHVVRHCGSLEPGEQALILCNPQTRDIADLFLQSALRITDQAKLVELPYVSSHGQEPPHEARQAMEKAALTISLCVYSLAHSQARVNAACHGGRFLSLPMYSWELLKDPALMVDYRALRENVQRVADALTAGKQAHVTSSSGTDLWLDLTGRKGNAAPGFVANPGDLASPPDVEANVAPLEGETHGVIVADGSITLGEIGLLERPVVLQVRNGHVTQVEGGQHGIVLDRLLGAPDSPRRIIGELGVGLNPQAKLKGIMLTDEGSLGCIHFGLGSNFTIGGANKADCHVDVVVRHAQLQVDDHEVNSEK